MIIRKFSVVPVLVLLATVGSFAQEIRSGWFGGIGVGIGAYDNDPFSDRLQSWAPIGETGREIGYVTDRFSNTGYTLSAGGAALFGRHFLIGASGECLMFRTIAAVTSTEEQSQYKLTGGGGGLDLG